MQLAHEELRDVLGHVPVREGAAGHAQAGQGIEAGHFVAERLQKARKGAEAGGQGAGRPVDGAQRAMIEADRRTARRHRVHIARGRGHAAQKLGKEDDIERHGELRPADPGPATSNAGATTNVASAVSASRSPRTDAASR